ncbi:MAG: AAA family ATPase [Pirellulaceae bacterium]|nr:AAA family ATPase [Pirellulaceae bacterium]
MLNALAISGYRSLKDVVLSLGQLNVVTGANGSGKSSLYRSLRLLADIGSGNLIASLAREGGLTSTLWAGPEMISDAMDPEPTIRKKPISLQLGFASDEFCYSIDLGLPTPSSSAFSLDPVIKRECLWRGTTMRPSTLWTDRHGPVVKCRDADGEWTSLSINQPTFASVVTEFADPQRSLDLMVLRELLRSWRFYDHMRTDREAPARQLQVGTYSPVLAEDGGNLAAALQTVREIGDGPALDEAISDAFPGSRLQIDTTQGRFEVMLKQPGLLRALRAAELSDGTLRYLLLLAALTSPRPPELLVLNEPETSLHPDLIQPLGRLIASRVGSSQIIVVTHSLALADALSSRSSCFSIRLEKVAGATRLSGENSYGVPAWKWPSR